MTHYKSEGQGSSPGHGEGNQVKLEGHDGWGHKRRNGQNGVGEGGRAQKMPGLLGLASILNAMKPLENLA